MTKQCENIFKYTNKFAAMDEFLKKVKILYNKTEKILIELTEGKLIHELKWYNLHDTWYNDNLSGILFQFLAFKTSQCRKNKWAKMKLFPTHLFHTVLKMLSFSLYILSKIVFSKCYEIVQVHKH